jgi:2-polyprenyl-3-methyl-5-hydroxy-6-metoxy-1,4-benzoquinol methylase
MKQQYQIVEDRLGFLRVDPIPTKEEVERFYKEEFYSSEYKYFNDSSRTVQLSDPDFFGAYWEAHKTEIEKIKGPLCDLSILDIGCGFALGMECFKRHGATVYGMDPSPEAIEYACENGVNAKVGFEDFTLFGDTRFDVVTMINVLEHLRDPADVLKRLKSVLKPDGLLVIDVPNEFNAFQTIANEEHGLGEWWVCPPNHINYFNAESLPRFMQACDYQPVKTKSSFPLEMFLLMGDVYVGDGELGSACHRKRVLFEKTLRKHGKADLLDQFYVKMSELNLGRQVTVYAKPGE